MIIALQTLIYFRESLIASLHRWLRPYYNILFIRSNEKLIDDDEADDQVFAEFDDEKGVVFYPPVYLQRYAAVSDCLLDERWCGKLEKVVDFGYHDMSFIKYLKEVPGINTILGVDLETVPLRCSSDLLGGDEFRSKTNNSLKITLFEGNAADPDYRLIGCEAVTAIEMIEHMLTHDLDRIVHNIFGFIKPKIAVITTPNGDFNVLFNNLEKNGLRRMDHFFEWSREQFHDWCSNIVLRYPQYTVSCKGIGPGPPGMSHLGCCSQLALFINQDYHKQQDLDLNSLTLVAKQASENIYDGFESPTNIKESKLISPPKLNCTTLEVKKFSRTTQNLMARHKTDSSMHTRDVVDKIKYFTKILNFKGDNNLYEDGKYIWYNINWGDNAPYWNQYYKVIREYCYPLETKTEESRILDLISDEINRLIDNQYDDEFSIDVDKMEIPLEHLLSVVSHITTDTGKVKDLLEWNGYNVVGDVVIHSRQIMEDASLLSTDEDWPDNETNSDWDTATDVRSSTWSEANTVVPDYNGRCLRRVLDNKVKMLRSQLTVEEECSAELDKVVCKLMKLALKTSRCRQNPPPSRWMLCKLLDLLSLTEKAIQKRRMHMIEKYPLNAIEYGRGDENSQMALNIIKKDNAGDKLIDKYSHLFQLRDEGEEFTSDQYKLMEFDSNDDVLSTTGSGGKDEFSNVSYLPEKSFWTINEKRNNLDHEEVTTIKDRTLTWIKEEVDETFSNEVSQCNTVKSNETDIYTAKNSTTNLKIPLNKYKTKKTNIQNFNMRTTDHVTSKAKQVYIKTQNGSYKSKTGKKTNKKKSPTSIILKKNAKILNSISNKNLNDEKQHRYLQSRSPNPIPDGLLDFCDSKYASENDFTNYKNDFAKPKFDDNLATTKESHFIDIVSENHKETIAMRRTIGVDAIDTNFENEIVLSNVFKASETNFCGCHLVNTENFQSQTIFLKDINEPSTSKGKWHTSTDVQCEPDTNSKNLSTTSSYTRIPKIYTAGIKIGDSSTNIRNKISVDCGTYTLDNESENMATISRKKYNDITIKESNRNLTCQAVQCEPTFEAETKIIKPILNILKIQDSCSEYCASVSSNTKSQLPFGINSETGSDLVVVDCKRVSTIENIFNAKCIKSKLSCGGINVHSYRDRKVCEDIIYQGNWQKMPKIVARKNPICLSNYHKQSYDYLKKKKNSKDKILEKKALQNKLQKTNDVTKKPVLKTQSITVKQETSRNIKSKSLSNNSKHENSSLKKIPFSDQAGRKNKRIVPKVSKEIKPISFNSKKVNDLRPKTYVKPIQSTKTLRKFQVASKITTSTTLAKNIKPIHQKPENKIKQLQTPCDKKTINEVVSTITRKNYLPLYLRKLLRKSNPTITQSSITNEEKQTFDYSKLIDVKTELVNFQNDPLENVNYAIFQNEVDLKNKGKKKTDQNRTSLDTESNFDRKSLGSFSPDTSSCSSPNSIATIRESYLKFSNRKQSVHVKKSNLKSNDSKVSTPKKFSRKASFTKKSQDLICNKENLPEYSGEINIADNVSSNKNKNVHMAQYVDDIIPLQACVKSHVIISTLDSTTNKYNIISQSSTPKKVSLPLVNSIKNFSEEVSYNVDKPITDALIILEHKEVTKTSDNLKNNIISSVENDVVHFVRDILKETLDCLNFIEPFKVFDSETVISECSDVETDADESISSLTSYKTVVEDDLNLTLQNQLEDALTRQFDARENISNASSSETRKNMNDLEFLSFTSIETKLSNSLNHLNDDGNDITSTFNENLLQGLYERKNSITNNNTSSALASQVFSGFSMNDVIAGDTPEYVNLVDSETGSLAQGAGRQATSEECFMSGRSSSYESCVLDEDGVVPEWLFDMLSHQQMIVVPNAEAISLPMPDVEPLFDVNGNMLDPGVDISAGAGDGRGMHSDQSQDSSGQGTSISTSDTSSGPHSVAILIDPTTFTTQYDPTNNSNGNALVITGVAIPIQCQENSRFVEDDHTEETGAVGTSRENRCGDRANVTSSHGIANNLATSDIDADVSSLDTDNLDSSDD